MRQEETNSRQWKRTRRHGTVFMDERETDVWTLLIRHKQVGICGRFPVDIGAC